MNRDNTRASKQLFYSSSESKNLNTKEQEPTHEVKRSFFYRLKRGVVFTQLITAKYFSACFEVK
jgi:hypothetical protein